MRKKTELSKCGKLILNKKKNKPNQKSINKLIINGKQYTVINKLLMLLTNIFQVLEILYLNKSVINNKKRSHTQLNSRKQVIAFQSYKDYLKNPLLQSIYLTPTNKKEIWTEIDKLKPKKSIMDIFNVNMLKYVEDEMIPGPVIIFNSQLAKESSLNY